MILFILSALFFFNLLEKLNDQYEKERKLE